jgi:hypothetical protein
VSARIKEAAPVRSHAHRCRRAMAASEWDLPEFDPAAVTVEPAK